MRTIFIILILATTWLRADFQEAFDLYQQGELATTIEEREQYFNQALLLYAENEIPNAQVYYNLGNCYYQLDQLGHALWYYHKACKLRPRDPKIIYNLQAVSQALDVPTSLRDLFVKRLFFFHFKLSEKEQSNLFIACAILAFLLASIALWRSNKWVLRGFSACLLALLMLLASLLHIEYAPSTGLFVEPAAIHCDAGLQYQVLDPNLCKVGEKCKILSLSENRDWVRVKSRGRPPGYVLSKHVRLL